MTKCMQHGKYFLYSPRITCRESPCCGTLQFMSLVGSFISGVVGKPGARLLEVTPKTFADKGEMLLGRQEGQGNQ